MIQKPATKGNSTLIKGKGIEIFDKVVCIEVRGQKYLDTKGSGCRTLVKDKTIIARVPGLKGGLYECGKK